MKNRVIIIWMMVLGLVLGFQAVSFGQDVQTERSSNVVTIGNKQYYMHTVKRGETLYGLSKVYDVPIEEITQRNPEVLENGLQADMVIGIPVKTEPQAETPSTAQKPDPGLQLDETTSEYLEATEVGDGYIVYTVKKTIRTKKLLRSLDVEMEDFRVMNPSVGSSVFSGQKIMVPYNGPQESTAVVNQPSENQGVVVPVHVEDDPQEGEPETQPEEFPEEDPVVVEEQPSDGLLFHEDEKPYECYASAMNADRLYRVALLTPLYLNEIDKLDISKEKIEKTKKARTLKFLQFYEGFMMAVDSLTNHEGLRLELTVMDVTENVKGAEDAVEKLRNNPVDMIIGPFFSKSFAVVQAYAAESNTMIVNPMSERESILSEAPYVVKLKPNDMAIAAELSRLLQKEYPKAKVCMFVDDDMSEPDSVLVSVLERALTSVVPEEVQLSNSELLDIITQESQRRKMGKKLLSTFEMEGKILSTKSLQEDPDGIAYFENHFNRYSFNESELKTFKEGLSSGRENVLIAFGDDVVFATKILNNINKSTQDYPVTLIGLPDWPDYDNLLVENLLNMNAIYFDDHFVDYNDSLVMEFVDEFRAKYECEPMDYAFEGFDVGWYFLNALIQYGDHPMDCLPYYHLPLLHTRYYFNKTKHENGLENRFWNIYQYDKKAVELRPIRIHGEE